MKTCHNLFVGVGFFILCCTMFTACVNHISEEEGEIINNGDIPLKFVADIHEIMNTRVVNNSFGEKDEVIIRKSKFPQNPKRSVRFLGKGTKRSVQKRKARNTQKAETKVL